MFIPASRIKKKHNLIIYINKGYIFFCEFLWDQLYMIYSY